MKPALVLLASLALSGCLVDDTTRTQGENAPITPAPMPDDAPDEGIAVGEPHPGAGGGTTMPRWIIATGQWCHYDDAFDGRVFGDQKSFDATWNTQLACEPDSDRTKLPTIDWDKEFRVALIATPHGCVDSQVAVHDVDTSGDHYVITYEVLTPDGDMCATAMSRPVAYLQLERVFGDDLDVEFREV